jgi:hypothetical protein
MTDSFRVNFLIVGTQKGGTSALAKFLAAHQEICMAPNKEVHFFDTEAYTRCADDDEAIAAAYRQAFPNFSGQRHVGEATPIYMFLPGTVDKIHRYNPEMKLICVLRDPVERALSHYAMERGRGRETFPLPMALLAEPWRLRNRKLEPIASRTTRHHTYLSRGFYSEQIENLLRRFPRAQLHTLTSDDLWDRHEESLQKIYRFLGVADLTAIAPQERIFASDSRPFVPPGIRPLLRLYYRREVARLERLLGWNLSGWK